jgi:hypothetical protein
MTVTTEKQDLSPLDQMEQEIIVTPVSNVDVDGQPTAATYLGTTSSVPKVAASAVSNAGTTVEVIAPSELMGGYQFNVNAGNKSLLVEVVGTYAVLFRLPCSPSSNLQTLKIYIFLVSFSPS